METLTTLSLHLFLVLIEYKPPSVDNLQYLIQGGHPTLKRIYNHLGTLSQADHATLIEDLTINEYFRLVKLLHGKSNIEPLYQGLTQYFQNCVDCQSSMVPGSMVPVPFLQEVFVLTWRLLTTNQHVFEAFTVRPDFHHRVVVAILLQLD